MLDIHEVNFNYIVCSFPHRVYSYPTLENRRMVVMGYGLVSEFIRQYSAWMINVKFAKTIHVLLI